MFATTLFAKDFMGLPIENTASLQSRPLPTFMGGGGGFFTYYLNSVEGGVSLFADYRAFRRHSFGLHGQMMLGNDLCEVGLNWKFYFRGSLMELKSDDYLLLGVSGLYMDKRGGSYFPPVVSVGYGRDVLFFETAPFIGRIELRGSYVLGESIAKREKSELIDRETNLVVYLSFSILFF